MEIKQPFEKDLLTEEEMISVATMNGEFPIEKRMMQLESLKQYQKEHGTVKGMTMTKIEDSRDLYL